MNVLVTGGAGYIGSHVALRLAEKGVNVFVCDDLSTGRKDMVLEGELIEANIMDSECEAIFQKHPIDAVMHFAAFCDVEESTRNPLRYYYNNTLATIRLLEFCQKYQVKQFIFSSTAAVYGIPEQLPVDENTPLLPINPYGNSKLACEMALSDLAQAGDIQYVALRYFNVAGADPAARIGAHKGQHLIKSICRCAVGETDKLYLFGVDYATKDGSCVRDYIHVFDIAEAHVLALDYLQGGGESLSLNCGYGHGYSVLEIIEAAKRITGIDFEVSITERRAGDPPALVAGNSKIKSILGWEPRYDSLDQIIGDAWRWEKHLLNG